MITKINFKITFIYFSKTLTYETTLRQNRNGDVVQDITQSLDTCATKLSLITNNSNDINRNNVKQIEIFIVKLRMLLNDIELISFDIEQLKQSNYEDKQSVMSISNRWRELLKKANEKYRFFQNKLRKIKLTRKLIEQAYNELNLTEKQINESTINIKFTLPVECLERIEEEVDKELTDNDCKQIKEFISKQNQK